jgi:hypothetical protein
MVYVSKYTALLRVLLLLSYTVRAHGVYVASSSA